MITFILFLLVLIAGYVIWNLLKKLEKYEEVVDDYQAFIQTETTRNEALLEALRQIDNRQMFEKDDEVGSLFTQIKETIQSFKEFNENAEETEK